MTKAARRSDSEASGAPTEREWIMVSVRLTPDEVGSIDVAAAAMGLTRTAWVQALLRRWISGKPTFSHEDGVNLISIHADMRRIAVNMNHIARILEAEARADRPANPAGGDVGAAAFDALRAQIRAHMAALRAALKGNLAYWEVEG
jgi:hypothetical protein